MHPLHFTLGGWLVLFLSPLAGAQTFAERFANASEAVEEANWHVASTLLLALDPKVANADERERLARLLDRVAAVWKEDSKCSLELPLLQRSLTVRQLVHGDADHADVAMNLSNIAVCLKTHGRAAEALTYCEQALAMWKRLYGSRDQVDVASDLNNVAACMEALGRAEEALPRYEQALAIWKRLNGPRDHPDVAAGLNNLAGCLDSLGRTLYALPHYEEALAMRLRLHGTGDHPEVARIQSNLAACLRSLGRGADALSLHEQALGMRKRLYGDRDHAAVAVSLINAADCLSTLGREYEAFPRYEEALAIWARLLGDGDHPEVARCKHHMAVCLGSLGRSTEALPQLEQALAMRERIYGDRDHPDVATNLNSLGVCLQSLGRAEEALVRCEQALAMQKRLYGDRDHDDAATSLNNAASCLEVLGRAAEALPRYEHSLAMSKRLYGDGDHPDVALGLNNVAVCLDSLGRAAEALPQFEQALAMTRRLFGDQDHHDVARGLNNLAACLRSLGREAEALTRHEQALAIWTRLHGDRDHPAVAKSLNNVAVCLLSLARGAEALPRFEQALEMAKRLNGERDHPDLARDLNNVAACLRSLGRAAEALPQYEHALAMWKRLYGDRDHADVATSMNNAAYCLESLGRAAEALPHCAQACDMIERLRERSRLSASLQQSFFDELKKHGAFELLQALAMRNGGAFALDASERSRGRDLLDLLEQQRFDPLLEAESRSRQRGDEQNAERLRRLPGDLAAAELESDRLLHLLMRLDERELPDAARQEERTRLLVDSNAVTLRRRQLLDERARLLGDVMPVGQVRTAAQIQESLQPNELLLEFSVTRGVALLYVLARSGAVDAIELPAAYETVRRVLPGLQQSSSHEQMRGRDPDVDGETPAEATAASHELFASLIPASVWERVRASRRVFVAGHRELHRLPFELLVTEVREGRPVHWLESGPPISYVPSGSALHWLRQRANEASDDATSLDLLAVGDPRPMEAEPELPENGVFVIAVSDGGEGARVGLQPGDVLTSYDGTALTDDKALRDQRTKTEAAIEDRQRNQEPIAVEVWRRGSMVTVQVRPGVLGIQVGQGRARSAYEASLGGDANREPIMRAGDLERIHRLQPLLGARAEIEALEQVFAAKRAKTRCLLGAAATEPAVFDLAAKAKYLHFACHGIAEQYAGQSLSMLVFSQPDHVLPGDDGLLKLGDLFHAWRGRLSSCRLVVLSACRTYVGPTLRDEAPQALPLGFLFAGAPAVISSLWAVDDASTKELMTDFYSRLLAGETDKLAAFTAAKKALRAKYPDPFHWAPFLYMGAPE